MRSGLLKRFQFADDLLSRLYANINDAINTLAADHDVVSAPVNSIALTAAIKAGQAINWYRGTPGATLTLPLANALGANVAAVVIVANASSGAITVAAPPTNTLTGTAGSVTTGASMVLVSDGISKWAAEAPGAGGGVSDGNKGDITVSGAGTVWTINPAAVTLAKMANLAADALIGRGDGGGAGVPQVITLGTGLTMTGTVLSAAGLADGNKGDVTVSGGGTVFVINPNVVTNADLAQAPANTIKGNLTGMTANVADVALATLSNILTVDDLTRNFRLLLARYVTQFDDVPPGLEDEAQIALEQD